MPDDAATLAEKWELALANGWPVEAVFEEALARLAEAEEDLKASELRAANSEASRCTDNAQWAERLRVAEADRDRLLEGLRWIAAGKTGSYGSAARFAAALRAAATEEEA